MCQGFVVEKLGFDIETVNQATRLEARRRRLLAELEVMKQSIDALIKIQRELEEEEIIENGYDARLHRRYKRLKEEAPYLSPLLEIERRIAGLFGLHY